jgi:acetoin utilization deacetylase AcuC-like enzyme
LWDQNSNVDVTIPYITDDEQYLEIVRKEFVPRVSAFYPELIFWEYGYDSTIGEYGDKGLTMDCHWRIAEIIKAAADEICHGRLIVVLCGGSSREIATYTIPRIIAHLAGLDHSWC